MNTLTQFAPKAKTINVFLPTEAEVLHWMEHYFDCIVEVQKVDDKTRTLWVLTCRRPTRPYLSSDTEPSAEKLQDVPLKPPSFLLKQDGQGCPSGQLPPKTHPLRVHEDGVPG